MYSDMAKNAVGPLVIARLIRTGIEAKNFFTKIKNPFEKPKGF